MMGFREAIWFLLVPMLAALAAVGIAGSGFNQKFGIPRRLASIVLFCFTMSLVLIEASGWELWSTDDPWKRCFWTTCLVGFWSVICVENRSTLYIGFALIAAWTSWLILPADASWKDLHPEFAFWSAWLVTGLLLNSFSLNKLAERSAQRWLFWVLVAQAGGLLLLAASAYSALAALSLALVAASVVFALFLSVRRVEHAQLWSAPVLFLCLQLIVATRLFSSPRPQWTYGLVTFLPSIVFAVDVSLFAPKWSWGRIATAALVSLILLSLIGWQVYGQ